MVPAIAYHLGRRADVKLRPISQLFKRHRQHRGKHSKTRNIRLSAGFYKALKRFAKEYSLTLVAAGDFMAAKAIEKVVEEQKEKRSKLQLEDAMLKTVTELGLKAKADRLAATPNKKLPGGTPGAAGH